jgi:hypothetical protein
MKLLSVLLVLLIAGCDLIPRTQLEHVQDKGALRVLTRNSGTTFYEGAYGPTGLEYDLAAGFAEYLDVRLELRVADNLSQVLHNLESRKADLAAAGLTVTEERRQLFNFSRSNRNSYTVPARARRAISMHCPARWRSSPAAVTPNGCAPCGRSTHTCLSTKIPSWKTQNC